MLAPTLKTDPLQPPAPVIEPYTKEAGTQTKYRESEAQTEPYAPEYRIPEGQGDPELLMLSGLTMSECRRDENDNSATSVSKNHIRTHS